MGQSDGLRWSWSASTASAPGAPPRPGIELDLEKSGAVLDHPRGAPHNLKIVETEVDGIERDLVGWQHPALGHALPPEPLHVLPKLRMLADAPNATVRLRSGRRR